MQKHIAHRARRSWLPVNRWQISLHNLRICAWSSCHLSVHLHTGSRRSFADASTYDLPAIDQKWQKIWAERAKDGYGSGSSAAQKMYILPMFPYPSGNLHLGHFRNYTIPDVLARFRRMQGYDILLPMGWDAFGLPAENAALERGIDPAVWTKDNISKMKTQLNAMNGSWDWSRELTTCSPSYYKHTQRIFLLLHERGLAYQAESLVNYDPVDKTVLANEQVDANGNSWRSGAKVEKKTLKQWFLRISDFRESLLDDLEFLAQDGRWPDRVLAMQKNWLGKSEGARIKFPIIAYDQNSHQAVEVFTTRPDTLFGVQYVALAANHPLVIELSKTDSKLEDFVRSMAELAPDSKAGYVLPTVRAINPLAFDPSTPEATKASLPVYVAPYVLGDYGEGAVMGVPGHDARDFAFWKINRTDEQVRMVIKSPSSLTIPEDLNPKEPFVHSGILTSQSGKYAGMTSAEASKAIVELLHTNGEVATPSETWRLRDWLISRQRYWGAPIPIIHCHSCGPTTVPEDQLPVELPSVDGHWLRGKAGNPLEDAHDWVNTACPKCGEPAKRDTDTMDTFVDSSWYFMRFADPQNTMEPFSADSARKTLPVDLYIGGVEHAILHLLYARFISKFIATTALWPDGAKDEFRGEPFKQLLTQGMVHGKTYTDPQTGRFLKPEEVDLSTLGRPIITATGETPNISFEKMSKSKYNGVDPTSCISKYGADATRAHILFQAPPSDVLEWDEEKISGVTRWMKRLYDRVEQNKSSIGSERDPPVDYFSKRVSKVDSFTSEEAVTWNKEAELWLMVQGTITSVTESLSKTYSLNTVVSDLMILTNAIIEAAPHTPKLQPFALSALIRMMAPVTPAFSEECWQQLTGSADNSASVFEESFPKVDSILGEVQSTRQTCAVQVNGKLKFAIEIPKPSSSLAGPELQEWIIEQILSTKQGKDRLLDGTVDIRKAKKVIVVRQGRTVNFVL